MANYKFKLLSVPIMLSLLTACGHSDDDEDMMEPVVQPPTSVTYSYQVSITNLTYGQPFSPVFAALHNDGQLWQIGEMASVALEKLAEAGDSSDLATDANWLAHASGSGILPPGNAETIDISVLDTMPNKISVATMLVNTNDAITGVSAFDISTLTVGQSITMTLGSYDAGTEANSELAGTIPGPADGGEGYNAERDDSDFVAMHSGVVTRDDGASLSVLTQAHRFDNPTARITITRME